MKHEKHVIFMSSDLLYRGAC